MEKAIREPIVAGAFYPGTRDALRADVESLFGGSLPRSESASDSPVGLIAPHAGYPYSGPVAAAAYGRAAACGRPDVALILGANHTGWGEPFSLSGHAGWRTPIGDSPVDTALVARLADSGIPVSDAAFVREHSVEVQLPFIQCLWGCDLPIVPLCVLSGPFPPIAKHAESIGDALEGCAALVVASSDFTHYEPDAVARARDGKALERIRRLDTPGFDRLYREERMSICGAGSILALLEVCRRLGLTEGELVQYATSGDATGDRSAVVGYAGVVFTREAPCPAA